MYQNYTDQLELILLSYLICRACNRIQTYIIIDLYFTNVVCLKYKSVISVKNNQSRITNLSIGEL